MDANENGVQDAGESGLGGVSVTLMRRNSIYESWSAHGQTTSDSSGFYSFTNLTPGYYLVNFGNKAGYRKTTDHVGSDQSKDSEARYGESLVLYAGQSRTDIDGGYIADAQREPAYFQLPENSPVGTVVGSVGDPSRFSGYSLTSPWFAVSDQGVITVIDNSALDYERTNPRFEFPVIAFGHGGISSNVVFDVIVDLTNVNEGPEYNQSTSLQGAALNWVSLLFKDPEGDDVQSINGNPQNGILIVNPDQHTFSPQGYWVPSVNGAVATSDSFDVSASDGQVSGSTVTVDINVTGSTTQFGRFAVGTTPPPKDVDTDLGAIGDPNLISDPSAGFATTSPTAADHFFKNVTIPVGAWYRDATPEARAALDHFLGASGTSVTLDVQGILNDSDRARGNWDSAIQDLVSWIDSTEFVGTLNVVDSAAHLGNTGDSVWSAAVGDYTGWTSAQITSTYANGTFHYSVDFVYHMWDPYDWDPTKTQTWQPQMASLHLSGLGQQYMTSGQHSKSFQWTKGSPPAPPSP